MKVRFFRINGTKYFIINMPTLSISNMRWLFKKANEVALVGTANAAAAKEIYGYSGAIDKLETIIISRKFDPKDVVILKAITGTRKSIWKKI